MNFAPVFWLDTFELAGSLRTRAGLFKADPDQPGLRILAVRGFRKGTEEADEDFVSYSPATKWVELTNLLGRMRRIGQNVGGAEFGRVFLEMLDPGVALPWHRETTPYFERWKRAVLPIRTNPGTMMFAGTEAYSPGVGWLTVFNPLVPCSAINTGEYARVHLVVDFRVEAPVAAP